MNKCSKTIKSTEPGLTEKSSQEVVLATDTLVPAGIPVFDKKRYQHDAFGKSIFRDVRYTKEIVKWICRGKQELLDVLDVDQIEVCPESFLDEELKNYYADILYRIPLKNGDALVMYILIEFKTSNDRFTIFQMVKYIVRILDGELNAANNKTQNFPSTNGDEGETDLSETEFERGTFLLPFVFPVIFHQGESPFTAPVEVAHLQHSIPGLKEYLLKQKAFLFDMPLIPDSEMPDDLALGSFMRIMRDIGKKDLDVRLLNIYKKIFPSFDKMPELLKVWEQILYYAVSSGKHFTRTKFNETTATIKEIRGNDMSSLEQPMYLSDVFMAEGFALGKMEGEAKGKVEGKVEVAKKMLDQGYSIDIVTDLTGLSSGEIKSISVT